jgi:hypothetical protein
MVGVKKKYLRSRINVPMTMWWVFWYTDPSRRELSPLPPLSSCRRIKFFIPIFTASIALFLCLLVIADCKSSIQVGSEWFGLFSYAADNSESCVAYTEDSLPTGLTLTDSQLVTARVASLIVVLAGLVLWMVLVFSPFCRSLNGVWPKLISISTALIIGNLQLLNVAKFVRFVLDGYPEEKVFYEMKGVIVFSIIFWFLTAIAISLCGVKPLPRPIIDESNNNFSSARSTSRSSIVRRKSESKKLESLPEGKEPESSSSRVLHLLVYQTTSEDTNETNGTTKDVEEGGLGRSISVDTPETNEMEDIEIVLTESEEGTAASF